MVLLLPVAVDHSIAPNVGSSELRDQSTRHTEAVVGITVQISDVAELASLWIRSVEYLLTAVGICGGWKM